MPGRVQNPEVTHLIDVCEHPLDRVRRALPKPCEELGEPVIRRRHRTAALHRVDVIAVAGERDRSLHTAQRLRAALVVGMGVGERQQGDLAG